jgi:hypothetical protein
MSHGYVFGPDGVTRDELRDELLALAGEAYERACEAFTAGGDDSAAVGRGMAYLGFARACRATAEGGNDA